MKTGRFPPMRREKRSEPLSQKDKITICISIAALVISAGTAYYNFRQIDEVSVLVNNPPLPRWEAPEIAVAKWAPLYVTFINSGNRPAVLGDAVLLFKQSPTETGTDCNTPSFAFIDTPTQLDLGPMILKERELSFKELSIKGRKPKPDGALEVPLGFEARSVPAWWMRVCLVMSVITPGGTATAALTLANYNLKAGINKPDAVGPYTGMQRLYSHKSSALW